jgi:AraC family transcriptional regulator, transcriptional activator of pobA
MIKKNEPLRKTGEASAPELCCIKDKIMTIMTGYTKTNAADYHNKPRAKYYSVAQKPVFEIQDLEQFEAKRKWQNETPAKQLLFEMIWIKQGAGKLLVDLEQFDIKNDTVYCIEPGQFYLFQESGNIKGYSISFSAEFINMADMFIGLPENEPCGTNRYFSTVLNADLIKNETQEIVEAMIAEHKNCLALYSEVLRSLLSIFIVQLTRNNCVNKNNSSSANHAALARKFIQMLNENLTIKKMVSDYANELAITPNYLNQVMKRNSGFTASHHIQQSMVLEAKRQALYFGNNMKDIAYYLGFDDLSHFSKFFKKNAGTSFRQFKNELAHC